MHILAPGSLVYVRESLEPKVIGRFVDDWEPEKRYYEVYSEAEGEVAAEKMERKEMVADWELSSRTIEVTSRALRIANPDYDEEYVKQLALKIAIANAKEMGNWDWCRLWLHGDSETTCEYREGGGVLCEVVGEHGDNHRWTWHTINHRRWGNGYSCVGI